MDWGSFCLGAAAAIAVFLIAGIVALINQEGCELVPGGDPTKKDPRRSKFWRPRR